MFGAALEILCVLAIFIRKLAFMAGQAGVKLRS